jgi:excisionase family DNA binding protein
MNQIKWPPENIPPPQPLNVLTISQAAELLGVTEQTIRNRIKRGELPPLVNIMGARRWVKSEFLEWLSSKGK